MKTLFVAIASMILSQTVMAQKEENKPVPKEVIKAHSMKFPDGELKNGRPAMKDILPNSPATGRNILPTIPLKVSGRERSPA